MSKQGFNSSIVVILLLIVAFFFALAIDGFFSRVGINKVRGQQSDTAINDRINYDEIMKGK